MIMWLRDNTTGRMTWLQYTEMSCRSEPGDPHISLTVRYFGNIVIRLQCPLYYLDM